jgi:uncharacterized alkaline shock family protein YloU
MIDIAQEQIRDKVTIAPSVLLTVARYATLGVDGVARMGNTPGGVDRIFRRNPAASGVMIVVNNQDRTVACDLYIVVEPNVSMREVSYNVQREVARAMHEIVGMDVLAVNIHIEDVAYDSN